MKKEAFAILEPGSPLMTQAIDALRRYHEAQAAGQSVEEVERLRLKAEGFSRLSRSSNFGCWGTGMTRFTSSQ
ncbi:hypothetical protein [Pseudomonas sp.]|uniref:hypothetical protein n=1 Tax=Pseudomonas sp. TaxID=306 RepID=UPI003D6FEE13